MSALYKIPRLKKGAVPSQFPWTEEPVQFKTYESLQTNSTSKSIDSCYIEPKEPVDAINGFENETISFCNILHALQNKNLILPKEWLYTQKMYNNINLLIFYTAEIVTIEKYSTNRFTLNITKEVILKEDLTLQFTIFKQPVAHISSHIKIHENVTDLEKLRESLSTINELNICYGITDFEVTAKAVEDIEYADKVYKDVYGIWRHRNCILYSVSYIKTCQFCNTVKIKMNQKRDRIEKTKSMKKFKIVALNQNKQKKILMLQQKYYKIQKAKKRTEYISNKLKNELNEYRIKINEISLKKIETLLKHKQILLNEFLAIKEIIKASKHENMKEINYNNEDWLLLCMLMHMRSSETYDFLRSNQQIPMPCVRIIRRYFSFVNCMCGFDLQIFEMLRLEVEKKRKEQKHGVILLDEIHLREPINFKSMNFKHRGLIDFGEKGIQTNSLDEKTSYGLVIKFQPIADTDSQPITIFASRETVSGEILAKLIIKAIVSLENINLKIHGVVSDGDATNRKFWSIVGVSGVMHKLNNSFIHPTDDKRKVFVFSGTSYLLKTIRNRLYNASLRLSPDEKYVKWDYFIILYNKDKSLPASMRVCPKITQNHLTLANAAKMKDRLAAQVFSKSMANGLRLYKHFLPELEDCDSTANFCDWINDLFDSLNHNSEGLTADSLGYAVLHESIKKLDVWEEHVIQGNIADKYFLTRQMAECLRITLKSTIDIINYLTVDYDFISVLTGRLNQYWLEV
ncbi:uncharacterized protein [Prorops nasuta]